MQSQTHTFIVNDIPLPCLQAGCGEPLLLIHGKIRTPTFLSWLQHKWLAMQ
jgi:hypothetical protein